MSRGLWLFEGKARHLKEMEMMATTSTSTEALTRMAFGKMARCLLLLRSLRTKLFGLMLASNGPGFRE